MWFSEVSDTSCIHSFNNSKVALPGRYILANLAYPKETNLLTPAESNSFMRRWSQAFEIDERAEEGRFFLRSKPRWELALSSTQPITIDEFRIICRLTSLGSWESKGAEAEQIIRFLYRELGKDFLGEPGIIQKTGPLITYYYQHEVSLQLQDRELIGKLVGAGGKVAAQVRRNLTKIGLKLQIDRLSTGP